MAPKRSAGLLLFRSGTESGSGGVEVLIGHMGGPLWAGRDLGGWSVPKGEYDGDESALDAARREFAEELGLPPPAGDLVALGEATQHSGKVVTLWAVEADLDLSGAVPGTFEMEWPPRSGRIQQFPELDRFEWFDLATAREKLIEGQRPFLDRLAAHLG